MHYYSKKGKPGYKRLSNIHIHGLTIRLYTSEDIFSKKGVDEGTRLLLENMEIPKEGRILDLGCGVGIIGIYALLSNPRLRAVFADVNPAAVRLAKINAGLNNLLDRASFVVSDVYALLENEKFDAIYSNPPLSAGWKVIYKMISEAPAHLRKNGWLQMVFYKGGEKALTIGSEFFRETVLVKRKKGYSILLFIV